MFNKQPTLTSIPERNENEEEIIKWVPKKKHEVLKAKYKCLKKLFQIYDASVIGILPETYNVEETVHEPEPRNHRRRRSHNTKTDACAGTTEISSGDVSLPYETGKSVATAVIEDLHLEQIPSSEIDQSKTTITKVQDDKSTQDSKENNSVSSERNSEAEIYIQNPHAVPYLMINERKPTRFQSFLQRILGIKRERYNYVLPHEKYYASSDNNISNRYEKRRRRGLRFRRLRRPKKIHSEIALRDVKSPVILSFVQSVQKNCLADTTPRPCPILGCKMISYGIINYNDHLNLCHFPERKFVCHYCHEGFTKEYDKIVHENEHIGITKLNANVTSSPSTTRCSTKIASDTQTDHVQPKTEVPEEKLKKIVSFFDKISDPDQIIAEIKKNRHSESNLQTLHINPKSETESDTSKSGYISDQKSDSDKRTSSCVNLQAKAGSKLTSSFESELTSKYLPCGSPVRCRLCGENFDYRRQLSLHVDLEHRVHGKFSKFHSHAGILNHTQDSEDSKSTQSVAQTVTIPSSTEESEVSRRKSDESLTCDPSTNIVYYTSTESIDKKPSVVGSLVQRVRSGFFYKWEPGTKIIRV